MSGKRDCSWSSHEIESGVIRNRKHISVPPVKKSKQETVRGNRDLKVIVNSFIARYHNLEAVAFASYLVEREGLIQWTGFELTTPGP